MPCIVWKCTSGRGNKEDQNELTSFHKFPIDEKLRTVWASAVNKDSSWMPMKHHRLCSKHFTEDCFETTGKWRRLKEKSIPTLNIIPRPAASIPSEANSHVLGNPESSNLLQTRKTKNVGVQTVIQKVSTAKSKSKIQNEATNTDIITDLKRDIFRLERLTKNRLLKINVLKQRMRRLRNKNNKINSKLTEMLEKEKVPKFQNILKITCVHDNKIIDYLCQENNRPWEFIQEVKKFAVTLHNISPQAYNFVREELNNALPHPKTVAKW